MKYALLALGMLASSALALDCNCKPKDFISKERVLSFKSPEWVINPAKKYYAVLDTTKGKITLELYGKVAPKSVNSFVFLALNHYYDGVPFHRVLEGFMAQTGDPTGTGSGGPGYSYYVELERGYEFNKAGVVGMARSQSLMSNGSQFFITFNAVGLADPYTVFGQLVEGMDVLKSITRIDPQKPDAKMTPDKINSVTILEEQ